MIGPFGVPVYLTMRTEQEAWHTMISETLPMTNRSTALVGDDLPYGLRPAARDAGRDHMDTGTTFCGAA
jgi:hypothetical protein